MPTHGNTRALKQESAGLVHTLEEGLLRCGLGIGLLLRGLGGDGDLLLLAGVGGPLGRAILRGGDLHPTPESGLDLLSLKHPSHLYIHVS